ncbi:MAG: histidinol-phosphate transaminase [Acidobacteria bacterium]|nr:histidinol-phosphate transaminase [Acidobacteriota bacterium]
MSHASFSPLSRPLGFECYPTGLGPSRRAFLRAVAATAAGAATAGALPGCDTAPGTQDAAPEPAPAGSAADALGSVPVFPEGGFAEDAVRIGFNENPLGPSPKALAAIAADGLAAGHRYNYPETVRDRIAAHHGARRENVLVGCGSTEFLQFLPWGFLKPGTTSLVLPEITYGWCGGVAAQIGAEVIRTPMGPEGTLDVAAMRAAIRPDTRIVYLANPNNPTGAAVSGDEIASLAEAVPEGGILIVDEAYAEFLPEDAVSMALAGGPVIVARTFSKAYGMAGLRFGYAIGSGPMFEKATGVWWGDFGLNTAAALACGPALADREHVDKYVQTVDDGLAELRSGLTELGCQPWPHRAPFLMTDLGSEALPVVWELFRRGIYVQDGAGWGLPTFLRISVGLSGHHQALLGALREIRAA